MGSTPTPASNFDQRIAALVPAALEQVRKECLNPVEKADLRHRLLSSMESAGVAQLVKETAEEAARRRAGNHARWARMEALDRLASVNELTPERRAYLRARAVEQLGQLGFLERMVEWLADREAEEDQESAALVRARKDAREAFDEVSDYLSYALNDDELAHLAACYSMFMRTRRRRWRAGRSRETGDYYTRPARLLGVSINVPKLGHQEFSRLVECCATQRDVIALFACWGVEARREKCEGVIIIVGAGYEVWPI